MLKLTLAKLERHLYGTVDILRGKMNVLRLAHGRF